MLQIHPDQFTYTSDHFPIILKFGEQLLAEGKAYIDNTPPDQMKQEREQRLDSKCRSNSRSWKHDLASSLFLEPHWGTSLCFVAVEQNMKMWAEMKAGSEHGQTCCMRAKIDMKSNNGCMRDPTLFRCKNTPHPRTGSTYKSVFSGVIWMKTKYDLISDLLLLFPACTQPMTLPVPSWTAWRAWPTPSEPQNTMIGMSSSTGSLMPCAWGSLTSGSTPDSTSTTPCCPRGSSPGSWSRDTWTDGVFSWIAHPCLPPDPPLLLLPHPLLTFPVFSCRDDPRFPTVRGVLRRGMTVEGLKQFIAAQVRISGVCSSLPNMRTAADGTDDKHLPRLPSFPWSKLWRIYTLIFSLFTWNQY